jgi:hypothetical protein
MLKSLEWIAIIATAALILALVGMAYLSSPPSGHPRDQQTTAQSENQNQTEKQHSLPGFVRFLFPDGIAVFTFFLVLATIGLGIVAIVQINFLERAETISAQSAKAAKEAADATRDSVNLAKDTAERQLRAYVYVLPPPQGIPNAVADGLQRAVVAVRNSGQTPAYQMQFRGNFGFGPYPAPTNPTFREGPYGGAMVLNPATELTTGAVISTEEKFSQADLDSIVDGKTRRLYIFGSVIYKDAFGKDRVTEFCFAYYGKGPVLTSMDYCGQHNRQT